MKSLKRPLSEEQSRCQERLRAKKRILTSLIQKMSIVASPVLDASELCFRYLNCEYEDHFGPSELDTPCYMCQQPIGEFEESVFHTPEDCNLTSHKRCVDKYIRTRVSLKIPIADCPYCNHAIGRGLNDDDEKDSLNTVPDPAPVHTRNNSSSLENAAKTTVPSVAVEEAVTAESRSSSAGPSDEGEEVAELDVDTGVRDEGSERTTSTTVATREDEEAVEFGPSLVTTIAESAQDSHIRQDLPNPARLQHEDLFDFSILYRFDLDMDVQATDSEQDLSATAPNPTQQGDINQAPENPVEEETDPAASNDQQQETPNTNPGITVERLGDPFMVVNMLLVGSTIKFIPSPKLREYLATYPLVVRDPIMAFMRGIGTYDLQSNSTLLPEVPVDPVNPGVFAGYDCVYGGCLEIENYTVGRTLSPKTLMPLSPSQAKVVLNQLYDYGWDPESGLLTTQRIIVPHTYTPLSQLIQDCFRTGITDISSIDLQRIYGPQINEFYNQAQLEPNPATWRQRHQRLHIRLETANDGVSLLVRALASHTGFFVPPATTARLIHGHEIASVDSIFSATLLARLGASSAQLRATNLIEQGYVDNFYRPYSDFGWNKPLTNTFDRVFSQAGLPYVSETTR